MRLTFRPATFRGRSGIDWGRGMPEAHGRGRRRGARRQGGKAGDGTPQCHASALRRAFCRCRRTAPCRPVRPTRRCDATSRTVPPSCAPAARGRSGRRSDGRPCILPQPERLRACAFFGFGTECRDVSAGISGHSQPADPERLRRPVDAVKRWTPRGAPLCPERGSDVRRNGAPPVRTRNGGGPCARTEGGTT